MRQSGTCQNSIDDTSFDITVREKGNGMSYIVFGGYGWGDNWTLGWYKVCLNTLSRDGDRDPETLPKINVVRHAI